MKKLKLVKDGIFPIIYDKDGNELKNKPDTGFNESGTISGEGRLIGTTCLFIRTSGCNLRCLFSMEDGNLSKCDTPYASYNTANNEVWEVEDIVQTIGANLQGKIWYIVISGGEPTIQTKPMGRLVKRLKEEFPDVHITIETNGTIFNKTIAEYVDLYSISPKLSNSVPTKEKQTKANIEIKGKFDEIHEEKRVNYDVIQQYTDMCVENYIWRRSRRSTKHDIQLKFVVSKPTDEIEIKEFISKLRNIDNTDIYLMPCGENEDDINKATMMTVEMAIKNGWSFSPRLHINLWGANKKGV